MIRSSMLRVAAGLPAESAATRPTETALAPLIRSTPAFSCRPTSPSFHCGESTYGEIDPLRPSLPSASSASQRARCLLGARTWRAGGWLAVDMQPNASKGAREQRKCPKRLEDFLTASWNPTHDATYSDHVLPTFDCSKSSGADWRPREGRGRDPDRDTACCLS